MGSGIDSKQRMEICKKCVFFTKYKFCKMCGCFMPVKTKIPFMKCPAEKW